jgi:hypothetical protein
MTAYQQLELDPGRSLGPFELGLSCSPFALAFVGGRNELFSFTLLYGTTGTSLYNVLDYIRNARDSFPHVNVAWDETVSSPSSQHFDYYHFNICDINRIQRPLRSC